MTISYTVLFDSCRPDGAFKKDFALSPQQTWMTSRFPDQRTRRGTLIAILEARRLAVKKIFAVFITITILAAVAAPASVIATIDIETKF
jgi:hypothetical protein